MQQENHEVDHNYINRLHMLKQLINPTSTFLKYSPNSSAWLPCPTFCTPHPYRHDTLTTLSLNVLFDRLPQQQNNQRGNMEAVLHSTDRYQHILDRLGQMQPQIISLQEVTSRFYYMLLECEWAKQKYWVADFKNYQHGWGNLLLTKIEPICLDIIKVKHLPRVVCTAFLAIQHSQTKEVSIVSFSCVHLIALDKNHEARVKQLTSLVNSLKTYETAVSETVLQGDMNFHAEFETESAMSHKLTDAWLEKYNNNLQEHPGYTFDSNANSMINEMYWGFERRQMRLDRIFYLGNTLRIQDIQIVFNQPAFGQNQKVNKHMFLKGGLLYVTDYFGWNLRGKGKEEYLFASDHFGLLNTFRIKPKLTQITKLI